MGAWINLLRERWQSWTVRERRMVAAMLAVIVLALVWAVAIDPAWTTRERLGRELPRLRAQAAELLSLLASVQGQAPSQAARQGSLEASLQAVLQAAGLRALTQAQANGAVRVQFEGIAYAELASWLDRVVRELGVRIETTKIAAVGSRVNADVVVTQ